MLPSVEWRDAENSLKPAAPVGFVAERQTIDVKEDGTVRAVSEFRPKDLPRREPCGHCNRDNHLTEACYQCDFCGEYGHLQRSCKDRKRNGRSDYRPKYPRKRSPGHPNDASPWTECTPIIVGALIVLQNPTRRINPSPSTRRNPSRNSSPCVKNMTSCQKTSTNGDLPRPKTTSIYCQQRRRTTYHRG